MTNANHTAEDRIGRLSSSATGARETKDKKRVDDDYECGDGNGGGANRGGKKKSYPYLEPEFSCRQLTERVFYLMNSPNPKQASKLAWFFQKVREMKKLFGFLIIVATIQISSAAFAYGEYGFFKTMPGNEIRETTLFLVKSKAGHCPPGLAKKSVPCVPPGQVKRYGVGDYIGKGYVRISDPERWGLRRNGYYVRAGNYVYEVDSETRKVLNLIGAIADVLN